MNKILNTLAKDLMKEYPRSPHETLGGYVIAARMLDKCRALVNGTLGEYRFDCPLDNFFLSFTSISSTSIMRHIESGANDEDVAGWITDHSDHSERSCEWQALVDSRSPDQGEAAVGGTLTP